MNCSTVFRCYLKAASEVDDITNSGRLFHVLAARTGKAWSSLFIIIGYFLNVEQHGWSQLLYRCCCVQGEKPDVSHIFQVSSQTLTTICQTNVYMTPAQVTPHIGSELMDSQVRYSRYRLIFVICGPRWLTWAAILTKMPSKYKLVCSFVTLPLGVFSKSFLYCSS